MLCLMLKTGERIVLRCECGCAETVVKLDRVEGHKAYMAFDAPQTTSINREKIQRAIDGADAIGAAPVDHERKRR